MGSVFNRIPVRIRYAAPFVAAVMFCATASPWAQEGGAKGADPVAARVDGVAIHQSDVLAAIDNLPPQYAQIPRETLVNAVLEKLIDGTLAARQARAAGLEKDPEFIEALSRARVQLLEQLFIKRLLARRVTERALRRRYERDRKSMTRDKEVRARHILVRTREEAEGVIKQLREGKDFAELARLVSTGPSKAQGGDLGFFKREQMVAPFATAAFALRKGEFSKAPVKTRYGWHVIKVEEIKAATPPSFDEVRGQLEQKMGDEVIEKEMESLRKAAKIERLLTPKGAAPTPK